MARIIIGLSGGVDSAVAAYLLKKDGHELIGVTLRTWETGGSRCCEIETARETARFLNIPYHVINCVSDFRRKVETPFIEYYLHGLTPNPCVICNPEIKWTWMIYAAGVFQAERIATGHYASIVRHENGKFSIQQATDSAKDQSYMLYRLSQEQLSKTVFPLGRLKKEEVRNIALTAGLPSARSNDSQEICFVTEGEYTDYLETHAADRLITTGNFVDVEGSVVGIHKGIIHYTVGQRKGLGLSMGHPVYVKSIRASTNEVVIAEENDLLKQEILCGDVYFSGIPELLEKQQIHARVKVRYHHRAQAARIEKYQDNKARICFDEPVRAPAPGQSAVFYDEHQCVIGGGIILPDE